jgi:hypothetical protein
VPPTTAQLARMRGRVRSRMRSTCQVLRATEVDTEGGTRIDYLPVSQVIPCGLRDPTIGAETVLAARIQASSVVTVMLPFYDDQGQPVTVRPQDRLQLTTPAVPGGTSQVVEVEGVQGQLTDYPIAQRAVCQALT